MSDPNSLARLVPGFEFLQSLSRNAGSAMPAIGHWVAPTLNPEEIEKRIEELRTVKFWLEQNGKMLDATIQALEVQRMTLSTLQTMNVQMGDLREAMMIRKPSTPSAADTSPGDVASSAMSAATAAATAFANAFQFPKVTPPTESPAASQPFEPEVPVPPHPSTPPPSPEASPAPSSAEASTPSQAPPAIDPMQWWGALTRQFTALATSAMKESAGATPPAALMGSPAASPAAAPGTPRARPRPARPVPSKDATPSKAAAESPARAPTRRPNAPVSASRKKVAPKSSGR